MNQMEIFKNPEFGSIRVIEENGKYRFAVWILQLHWDTAILVMRYAGIVRAS